MPEKQIRLIMGFASLVALLGTWELISRLSSIDVRLLSRPSLIVAASGQLFTNPELWKHTWISIKEFLVGFSASMMLGVPLGLAMGWYRRLRLFMEPTVMAFYSVPRTALIPLVMVWFGIGLETIATLVFLGAIFPILVNTMTGVQQVESSLVKAARSFGAKQGQIFRFVLLPSALPYVMGGIRLGLGRALIGVIVGEMYASVAGIGNLIMTYQSGLNTEMLMLLVFLVAAGGAALISLVRRVEDGLAPWRRERRAA